MVAVGRWRDLSRRHLERAARLRERVEAGELNGAMELTVAATEVAMAGESAERAAALAGRAIEALRADPILAVVVGFAARCLTVADRLDEAERSSRRRWTRRAATRPTTASARCSPSAPMSASGRGAPRGRGRRRGRAGAYAHAGRLSILAATAILVQALAERGELEAAEAALEAADADGPPDAIGDAYTGTLVLNARARLRLAEGNAQPALADLLEVGRRQEVMREPNPAASTGARRPPSPTPRSASTTRGRSRARSSTLARRFGAPRAIGIALRTLGVIGDDLDAAREAVDVLATSPARLEHARALADLGVALRHRRRIVDAREPLRQALDLATRCEAAPLAERARTELQIAGARPRRPQLSGVDALTTNERRVAALAAEGRSNREIAQTLYVSRKTVEKHLTAAYRKLGVGARRTCRGPWHANTAPGPPPRVTAPVHLGDLLAMAGHWSVRPEWHLLDLYAVPTAGAEPVDDVARVVTAEFLVGPGDAHLDARARRRALDGTSDLQLRAGAAVRRSGCRFRRPRRTRRRR